MNKKLKMLIKIILILLVIFTIFMQVKCFADVIISNPDTYRTNPTIDENTINVVSTILGWVKLVGVIASVIVLLILGIKYMLASLEQKAEYKKTALAYVTGAIILFSAPQIVGIIYDFVHKDYSYTEEQWQEYISEKEQAENDAKSYMKDKYYRPYSEMKNSLQFTSEGRNAYERLLNSGYSSDYIEAYFNEITKICTSESEYNAVCFNGRDRARIFVSSIKELSSTKTEIYSKLINEIEIIRNINSGSLSTESAEEWKKYYEKYLDELERNVASMKAEADNEQNLEGKNAAITYLQGRYPNGKKSYSEAKEELRSYHDNYVIDTTKTAAWNDGYKAQILNIASNKTEYNRICFNGNITAEALLSGIQSKKEKIVALIEEYEAKIVVTTNPIMLEYNDYYKVILAELNEALGKILSYEVQ